jgi:MFS family permease
MTTTIVQERQSILHWNLRHLYWDIFYFGILAGSTLAFQSIYAARLGASEFQIGLLTAGPAIVGLIFTLPFGRWMEGKSFIKVTFQSSILQRVGYIFLIALPWLFPSTAGQVWGVIWTTLAISVAGTVLAISFNALFAEVVPPEARAYAVGRRNVLLAVSITVSTLVSGQILDYVAFPSNYQIVFFLGAAGALLSSYHLGRIRRPETAEAVHVVDDQPAGTATPAAPMPDPAGGPRRMARGSSQVNTKDPPVAGSSIPRSKALIRLDLLRGPFGIFMLAYLAFYAFQYFPIPIFPIAYVDSLHMTDGMIGIGTAIFYGAMMLGSFRLSHISTRYGHRNVLWASAALFPTFPLLLGVAKGPVLYFLACLIGGGVNAMLGGAIINRLMERVPADDRAAHMTLHNMALNLGILAGSLLGPVAANLMGTQPSLILSAGLRLLAAGFFFLWG